MTVKTGSSNSANWVTGKGVSIEFNDDGFEWLKERLEAVKKVCKIGDVCINFNGFEYDDVSFRVRTEKVENPHSMRRIIFTVVVDNWRNYVGGSSFYSERGWTEYKVSQDSDMEPVEWMAENGAFFHLLSNRISNIIPFRSIGGFFALDRVEGSTVYFSQSVCVSRYD